MRRGPPRWNALGSCAYASDSSTSATDDEEDKPLLGRWWCNRGWGGFRRRWCGGSHHWPSSLVHQAHQPLQIHLTVPSHARDRRASSLLCASCTAQSLACIDRRSKWFGESKSDINGALAHQDLEYRVCRDAFSVIHFRKTPRLQEFRWLATGTVPGRNNKVIISVILELFSRGSVIWQHPPVAPLFVKVGFSNLCRRHGVATFQMGGALSWTSCWSTSLHFPVTSSGTWRLGRPSRTCYRARRRDHRHVAKKFLE